MVPYLVWISFAAILNFQIDQLNPDAESLYVPAATSQIGDGGLTPDRNGVNDMQSEKRIFDDLAKVLNGVAGTVAGMGREAEASMRERAREWAGGLDLVSREEFDAVKTLAANARAEADALGKRVAALEARLQAKGGAAPAKAKPATKSANGPI